ncbi:hypothetical protein B296_00051910 [Ensete ventricosum]|uniref:Uncharacterized protein n=1 Tax=Ensete ventricosum TaxID=4639 RepID=A0A426YEI7_ENSVE|nr:hypothetical protein B296_00051910 [Ensete ventricosum]
MLRREKHRRAIYLQGQERKKRHEEASFEIMETQKKPAISRKKASAPPPPPPPLWTPSAARRPIKVRSSTRDEIDRYWRMRRMIEEDHLLFAQKAAARIRTMALKARPSRFLLLDWVDLWHQKLFSLDLAAAMIELCCAGGRPSTIRGAAEEDERGGAAERRRKQGATDRNQGLVRLKPLTSALYSFLTTIKWTRSKYAYLNQPTIVSTGENAAPKRPTFLPLPGPGALLCHIIRSSLDARAQMLVAETDARP